MIKNLIKDRIMEDKKPLRIKHLALWIVACPLIALQPKRY